MTVVHQQKGDSLLPLDQGCKWEPGTHLALNFYITENHSLNKRIISIRSLLVSKLNYNLVYKISDYNLQLCYRRHKCFHVFYFGNCNTFFNFVAVNSGEMCCFYSNYSPLTKLLSEQTEERIFLSSYIMKKGNKVHK